MISKGKAPSAVAADDHYQTQEDLRTMQRAHEIKKDTKRHTKVKHLARKHLKALTQIAKGTPADLLAQDESQL